MELSDIYRLGESGISAFPPSSLSTASDWLWDFCEATGDARYCSLSVSLRTVANAFDEHDALPTTTVRDADKLFADRLPYILNARDRADASSSARSLREDLAAALSA